MAPCYSYGMTTYINKAIQITRNVNRIETFLIASGLGADLRAEMQAELTDLLAQRGEIILAAIRSGADAETITWALNMHAGTNEAAAMRQQLVSMARRMVEDDSAAALAA